MQSQAKQRELTNRPSLSHRLSLAVVQAADVIRRDHTQELHDSKVADLAARRFRAKLAPPRRRGRPRSEAVRLALEMQRQGKSWREIYSKVLLGYYGMDKYERQIRCTNLRRAVHKAQKRGQGKSLPPETPHVLKTTPEKASHLTYKAP